VKWVSRHFDLSLSPNFLYPFGAGTPRELGDSTYFADPNHQLQKRSPYLSEIDTELHQFFARHRIAIGARRVCFRLLVFFSSELGRLKFQIWPHFALFNSLRKIRGGMSEISKSKRRSIVSALAKCSSYQICCYISKL